jgi:sterol 3beta-glucosyltransferase
MITILCSGTRGDVQPYIALAQELKKLGLSARIATSRTFEGFVRGYGIDFYSIEVDHESAGVDPKMIREAQRADNILKMFGSFRKLRKYGIHMVEKYHEACMGSEAIVFHPGLTIGYFMAEKLGIPAILASPFPMHRTGSRPSVILYGKMRPKAIINRLSYTMLQGMLWMASESSLKPFWKSRYGQLPTAFGIPFERHDDARHPAIVSCSDHIFERPRDWNPHVHQHGYWVVEEPSAYQPSPELAAFLAKGDKPVYLGFGSMFDRADTGKVGRMLVEALALAGRRGILGGMNGLANLPETIIAVENVPHTWLFPQMAAVCHHGGAGTSAAGFQAGVPSIIVPFALDQFAWAQRSFELGIGSKPLPFKKMSAVRLSEAIVFATRPEICAKARTIGQRIAAERGARDCALVIARAMETMGTKVDGKK